METVLIKVKSKAETDFLLNLVKRLGMTGIPLGKKELEGWLMAQKIDEGMKSENVSRAEIMKALTR